jgi:hypothetical protein
MNYLAKMDVTPYQLRPLGPLLVPSPRNLNQSFKAMIKLERPNVFSTCEGNSILHRQNQAAREKYRVPCRTLITSYPFVKSYRDPTNGVCTEMLLFMDRNISLSLFKYYCEENLPRTL